MKVLKSSDNNFIKLCSYVKSHKDFRGRANFYRKYFNGNATIEELIVTYVMIKSNHSKNWCVNKKAKYAKLGKCWGNVCNKCTVNYNNIDCNMCIVRYKSFKDMWQIVEQSNYIFADLINLIVDLNK